MKKILIAFLACFVCAGAFAYDRGDYRDEDYFNYHLNDPFYIQPLGWWDFDTKLWAQNHADQKFSKDNSAFFINETLSVGFARWLVLGAGIGYMKSGSGDDETKGWLNPYGVGRLRFLDRLFKIDLLAKVTFDVFDTSDEGGIESGTQKYDGELLIGPRFEFLSLGVKGIYQYWRKGSEVINTEKNYQSNIGAGAFASVRPLSFFDFGGALDYIVYDALEDKGEKGLHFNLNANLEFWARHIALGAFYDFTRFEEADNIHALGARLKVAF